MSTDTLRTEWNIDTNRFSVSVPHNHVLTIGLGVGAGLLGLLLLIVSVVCSARFRNRETAASGEEDRLLQAEAPDRCPAGRGDAEDPDEPPAAAQPQRRAPQARRLERHAPDIGQPNHPEGSTGRGTGAQPGRFEPKPSGSVERRARVVKGTPRPTEDAKGSRKNLPAELRCVSTDPVIPMDQQRPAADRFRRKQQLTPPSRGKLRPEPQVLFPNPQRTETHPDRPGNFEAPNAAGDGQPQIGQCLCICPEEPPTTKIFQWHPCCPGAKHNQVVFPHCYPVCNIRGLIHNTDMSEDPRYTCAQVPGITQGSASGVIVPERSNLQKEEEAQSSQPTQNTLTVHGTGFPGDEETYLKRRNTSDKSSNASIGPVRSEDEVPAGQEDATREEPAPPPQTIASEVPGPEGQQRFVRAERSDDDQLPAQCPTAAEPTCGPRAQNVESHMSPSETSAEPQDSGRVLNPSGVPWADPPPEAVSNTSGQAAGPSGARPSEAIDCRGTSLAEPHQMHDLSESLPGGDLAESPREYEVRPIHSASCRNSAQCSPPVRGVILCPDHNNNPDTGPAGSEAIQGPRPAARDVALRPSPPNLPSAHPAAAPALLNRQQLPQQVEPPQSLSDVSLQSSQ